MAAPTVQASHHMTEETGTCSSSQKDDETKGNNIFKPKETSDQTGPEGFPEGSAVKAGYRSWSKIQRLWILPRSSMGVNDQTWPKWQDYFRCYLPMWAEQPNQNCLCLPFVPHVP